VNILTGLIQSISLILALTFIFRLVSTQTAIQRITQIPFIQGLLFGLFGIISLLAAIPIAPGYFFDSRYIIVVATGLFLGRLPMLIAAVMIGVVRIGIGGAGTLPAIFSLLSFSILIIWLHDYRQKKKLRLRPPVLIGIGLGITLITTFWTMVLGGQEGIEIVRITFVPTLLLYPVGMVLIGWLFLYQEYQLQLETRLKESEERFRSVVTYMSDGVVLHDSTGKIIMANSRAEHILGLKYDQLIGRESIDPRWHTIHEDGLPFPGETHPAMIALKSGKAQTNVIMGVYKPDGVLSWINVSAQPLQNDQSNSTSGAVVTFTDITELRAVQEKLQRERNLLRILIDHTPDLIYLKDDLSRYLLVNKSLAHFVNRNPQELIGRTVFDLYETEFAKQFQQDDEAVLKTGQALIDIERSGHNLQGEAIIFKTTKVPWKAEDGSVIGIVGISRDITQLKILEAQSLALEAEQQRVYAMQAFINDFSHDFRTPLSIINSSTYLLHKVTDAQKREVHLERIEEQSKRLLGFLNDFMEMAQLDNEDIVLEDVRFEFNSLITQVVQDFSASATLKQIDLEWIPADQPIYIRGNSAYLSRAVLNLVQNAINYTPSGGSISIQTARVDEQMMLTITDTGVGISESDLPHVFERFYRADKARSASTGGTGLGLSIARKIIEGHQGAIRLESQVGVGTTARVTIPLAHAATT